MQILTLHGVKAPELLVRHVVDFISSGRLVVLPTETVYGLTATCSDIKAIRKVYQVKGREKVPLTIHVASIETIPELVKTIPRDVEHVLEQVWPGPLTAIFWKSDNVHPEITAGSQKVGIRIPRHEFTLRVLSRVGPCVMPSANKHGAPSPTTVEDVIEDLGSEVDLIVDAGMCELGIDSTVIDFTETPPRLVRPGALTIEQLRELGVEVQVGEIYEKVLRGKKKYVKDVRLIAVTGKSHFEIADKIATFLREKGNEIDKILLAISIETYLKLQEVLNRLVEGKNVQFYVFGSRSDLWSVCRTLYKMFRFINKTRPDVALVETLPLQDVGLAITDRILSACEELI